MYFCSRSQTKFKKSCGDQWIRDGKTIFSAPGGLLPLWSGKNWVEETEVQTMLKVIMFGMVWQFCVQRGKAGTHGLFSKGKFPSTDNSRSNVEVESTNQESNSVSGIYTFICYRHNLGRGTAVWLNVSLDTHAWHVKPQSFFFFKIILETPTDSLCRFFLYCMQNHLFW